MKKTVLFIFILLPLISVCQNELEANGGSFEFNPNKIPCITIEEKAEIKVQLQKSINDLQEKGKLNSINTKLIQKFIWPVRKSSDTDFFDVWGVSNYLDHDTTFPDKLRDYNGGTRTYDTNSGYNHQGTDIYTWPFSWYQFENNSTEVIAAAAGTIVLRRDGNPDMSCNFNNNQWNAIYLRHSDGSTTWYGHLKSGTLTSKLVGDTVAAGEYLGVVGSSGSSSGPHLHFEVYDNANNLIDPYSGPSNNITSWWADQKEYYESNINALLTHNAAPRFNTCPQTETVNIKGEFLPNQRVYLASYFRDQLSGTRADYKLYRPNGSLFSSWNRNFTNTYDSSYWYWSFDNLSDLGTWRFECTYQGKTESKSFEVRSVLSIEDEQLEKITIAPNPFHNTIKLVGTSFDFDEYKLAVYNNLGQKVFEQDKISTELNLASLAQGVYFLKVLSKNSNSFKTFPLIKN